VAQSVDILCKHLAPAVRPVRFAMLQTLLCGGSRLPPGHPRCCQALPGFPLALLGSTLDNFRDGPPGQLQVRLDIY
jgi:hypothetical protein